MFGNALGQHVDKLRMAEALFCFVGMPALLIILGMVLATILGHWGPQTKPLTPSKEGLLAAADLFGHNASKTTKPRAFALGWLFFKPVQAGEGKGIAEIRFYRLPTIGHLRCVRVCARMWPPPASHLKARLPFP